MQIQTPSRVTQSKDEISQDSGCHLPRYANHAHESSFSISLQLTFSIKHRQFSALLVCLQISMIDITIYKMMYMDKLLMDCMKVAHTALEKAVNTSD